MLRQEECVTLNSGESIGDPRDGSLWKDAVARHMPVRIIEGKKSKPCSKPHPAAAIERHLDFFDNSFKITGDPKKIDFQDGVSIAAEEDKCSK